MSLTTATIPALLRQRAGAQADKVAYTFCDGVVLETGHPETLTWSQLYRRVLSLAEELRRTAATGDRVAIVAPQGLDYIVAFYAVYSWVRNQFGSAGEGPELRVASAEVAG